MLGMRELIDEIKEEMAYQDQLQQQEGVAYQAQIEQQQEQELMQGECQAYLQDQQYEMKKRHFEESLKQQIVVKEVEMKLSLAN